MSQQCRLCLGKLTSGQNISIREPEFQAELQNVFHFEVSHSMKLPEHVCNQCRKTVSYCHSFCLQVQANQVQLHAEASENVLQPVEHVKVESLYDADSFELEEHTFRNGLDVNEKPCLGGEAMLEEQRRLKRPGRGSNKHIIELHEEPKKEEGCSKEELLSTQLKNERIIKEFCTLDCEMCSTTADNFLLLLDHYRTAHNTKGYVRCCGKQFFRRYLLADHIAAHRGTIRCEICQKTYKTKRYLALHISKSHSREEDRPFKCTKCHVTFPKQYLLRAHELLHVQQQCRICQKVLSSIQSLKVHIAQMHGNDGNHICETCGKMFRTKVAMERHIKEHMGLESTERLQCEHCQKWFNGKNNLSKHVRFLHMEDGQLFPCDICQHVAPNSRALANHKQRVHVEERFECEYCGKRFKRRPNLREHIASHTNVPLYACDICKHRTFNSKANYFTHRKNKHPQEWEAQKRRRTEREMNKIY